MSLDNDNNEQPPAILYDALPYIDATHEDYDEYAAHLIEQEMKRLPPRKATPLPPVRYRSPLMEAEMKRVAAQRESGGSKGAPVAVVQDAAKLEAPTQETVQAWQDAVRKAKIAYEKERIRHMTLDISKEGSTAAEQWKQMNMQLEGLKSAVDKEGQAQKAAVDAINLQRQEDQQHKGQELHILTTHYTSLVEKTHQLKEAVAELKEELKQGAGEK